MSANYFKNAMVVNYRYKEIEVTFLDTLTISKIAKLCRGFRKAVDDLNR